MVHNESVNVWTHLIGAICVFVLLFYTGMFLHYHREIITDFDFTKLKTEIIELGEPIIPNVSYLTENLKEYVSELDLKITGYKDKLLENINCISCVEDILNYISKTTDKIKSISGQDIQDEFSHILDYLKEKEEKWVEIYVKSLKEEVLPKWPLYCMLFGAIFCLTCSSVFHLFTAHSNHINCLLNRLDYAGISILIVGSCYPPYYYLFYCSPSKIIFIRPCYYISDNDDHIRNSCILCFS